MKVFFYVLALWVVLPLAAQNLQLHYDFRHTLDPSLHPKNYPSVSFEYFQSFDSLGSFLFKLQSDMNGDKHNIGQTFIQISQSAKFWDPPIYLAASFSGGLGVAPPAFGFYIPNGVALGISRPFTLKGAWLSASVQFRYTAFSKPSYDGQFTFYFGRGFFDYRILVTGSFVGWTENRNQGTEFTAGSTGKKVALFGDPQIWIKVENGFSLGSRVNAFYNLFGPGLKVYPTVGAQYKFR